MERVEIKMKKIIVFGRGKFFRENEKNLKKKYDIVCYLDNNCQRLRKEYDESGTPIYHPDDVSSCPDYPIILMAKQFIEMIGQLIDAGIDSERIVFGVFLYPSTNEEKILSEQGALVIENKTMIYKAKTGESSIIKDRQDMIDIAHQLIRGKFYKTNSAIQMLANLPVEPISRDFGTGRGKAIDRFYIEKFLEANKNDIRGDVLEIADNEYTLRYGENRVATSYILHVNGWGKNAIKGDLETGEGLSENWFDSLIITQTLMFIYDLKSAAANIYKIMKEDAVALITVAGISQISRYDADNWGSYWGFHEDALKKLFIPLFGEENVEISIYGNVKTAMAMLYGLCCEELQEDDFLIQDRDYPLILAVKLRKVNKNQVVKRGV